MTSLVEVYSKFGQAAEAAQLLETELGNLLMWVAIEEEELVGKPRSDVSAEIIDGINRKTLGQKLKRLGCKTDMLEPLTDKLATALEERNRLCHDYFRHHNFRRNSDEGRAIMLKDLEAIHDTLLNAYKDVMLLVGCDLEALSADPNAITLMVRLPI